MTTSATIEPELAEHLKHLETQSTEVAELGSRLRQEQFDWRPRLDKWSIGEHLSHLALTNVPYLDRIEAVLADARARGLTGTGPFRYGWLGNWFARSMEPPPRPRFRTPRQLEPVASRPMAEILREFAAHQGRLERALHDANGLDLGRATMRSPFAKLLKLSIGQAFQVLLGHNRRHLWHIRQILAHPEMPAAGPSGSP